MTDERWEEIKGLVKDKFELIDERVEQIPDESGKGEVEVLEFMGPLGKMKLERTNQPLLLDKKTIGSRRIGSETTVQYKYSDTEKVHKFKAYKWDDAKDEWEEMEMEQGSFFG